MSKPLHSLFALLSITLFLITCYAADGSNTSTLCPPSDFGNVSIRYPFWIRSNTMVSGEFCGYPDFGIECSEGKAIMALQNDTYYVTDINYDQHSITLVDIDVFNQECPRAKHNVSIANLPLSFNSLDMNLSFYFNCSAHPSSVDPIGCLKRYNSSDTRESYVFVKGDEAEEGFDCH